MLSLGTDSGDPLRNRDLPVVSLRKRPRKSVTRSQCCKCFASNQYGINSRDRSRRRQMGNPGLDRALFTRVACPVATLLRKRRRWVLTRPTELSRSFGADRAVRPASARTFGIFVRILPAEYALMGEGGDGLEPLSRRRRKPAWPAA